MKRLITIWFLCCAAAAGSFGVLMIEDRRLGVGLPFSLPLAFFTIAAAVPAMLSLLEWLRARRPVVVQVEPQPAPAPARKGAAVDHAVPFQQRARKIEGVVLLDWSTFRSPGRAA